MAIWRCKIPDTSGTYPSPYGTLDLTEEYMLVSADVMSDRRGRLVDLAQKQGASGVIVYGNSFASGAIRYLTGFTPRRDCYLYLSSETPHTLFVQFYNHVPNARATSSVPSVEWGGPSSVISVAELALSSQADSKKLGVLGPVPYVEYDALRDQLADFELINMGSPFWKTRLVKDAGEIELMKLGAALSDRSIEHLHRQMDIGITERELGAAAASFSVSQGGHLGICFLIVASMDGDGGFVPAQHWSNRAIGPRDMVLVELSAGYLGNTGQILRTSALDEPSRRVTDLHRVADEAFDAISSRLNPGSRASDLLDAARVIDDAGLTVCDDVVHGYGGGYLQPVLRTPATQHAPFTDVEFEPGMMVVVQPNVVAPDRTIGVQTGELLVVTEDGHESMHNYPRGIIGPNRSE